MRLYQQIIYTIKYRLLGVTGVLTRFHDSESVSMVDLVCERVDILRDLDLLDFPLVFLILSLCKECRDIVGLEDL